MRRRWILPGVLGLAALSSAQPPDVRLRVDLIGALSSLNDGPATLRLYDPLGRTSTFALTTYFESGLRVFVSERLQQIPNDPSRDPFEEYYVEDQRIWRLGKQFLPFGVGHFLRENVLAARGETNLAFDDLNITAAACDGGTGAQSGVTARVGNNFGVSAAIGQHFGISPTSFDLVRQPDATPGAGHGWGRIFGLDGTHRAGRTTFQGEVVWLTAGATSKDLDDALFDISALARTDQRTTVTVGWTRDTRNQQDFYRLQTSLLLAPNRSIEPMIRMQDGHLYDLSVILHIRL